jgi:microcystin-dependent protein
MPKVSRAWVWEADPVPTSPSESEEKTMNSTAPARLGSLEPSMGNRAETFNSTGDQTMTTRNQHTLVTLALLALAAINAQFSTAQAQTTAFTYQGQLASGAGNANGSYDLTFAVWDANVAGNFIAGPVTNSAVAVSNGLFTVQLDFGPGVFTGTNYWVEMGVRTNGGGGFSTLVPRQPLTPTPYALYAPQAGSALQASNAIQATSLSTSSPQFNSFCPVGSVIAFAGATAPPGWLLCDGSGATSRTTYSNLFAVIGTTYGTGNGSTTFHVPDMRGRTGIGAGQGLGGALSNRTLAQTLGEETHTLTVAEMPAHTHSVNDPGHSHSLTYGQAANGSGSLLPPRFDAGFNFSTTTQPAHTGITIGSNGGNNGVTVPHNVMQPSLVLNYIIKY